MSRQDKELPTWKIREQCLRLRLPFYFTRWTQALSVERGCYDGFDSPLDGYMPSSNRLGMDGSRPKTQPLGPDGIEVYRRPVVIDRNFLFQRIGTAHV